MIGNRGKRPKQTQIDYIVDLMRRSPTLTDREVSEEAENRFGRRLDPVTIGRYRRKAGILSSREARAAVETSIVLSPDQLVHIRGLIEKIVVPPPDAIRLSDSMWEVGIGRIGAGRTKMWIEHVRGKLIRCWLTAKEESWLQQALATDSLRESFIELMVQGRATIQKIIRHNSAIDLGQGAIPISEVLELSRIRDPKTFSALDKPPYELWVEHVALLKAIELFRLDVEEHFTPPGVHHPQPN